MAGWNLLFLHRGPIAPDPSQTPEWNRGAYLAEGLGHCGACHTPRNIFGAEQSGAAFAGGDAENWFAPALNANATAPEPWTVDSMTDYLRRGWVDSHSASSGPMELVYHNLGDVSEDDVRAIATYVVSLAGPPSAEQKQRASDAAQLAKQTALPNADAPGASVFEGACNNCHRNGGPTLAGHLPLALYTAVNSPDPRNLIHVIMDGVHPVEGEAGPIMPGFAAALTDDQIAALATYIRSGFSKEPAWTAVDTTVHAIRQGKV
jgi:mono/diheme cytochrome c family protein